MGCPLNGTNRFKLDAGRVTGIHFAKKNQQLIPGLKIGVLMFDEKTLTESQEAPIEFRKDNEQLTFGETGT